MKLTLPWYLAIALTALVVFLLLTRPSGTTEDNSKDIALTRQIDSLQRSNTELVGELAKYKVEFRESKKESDTTIAKNDKNLASKKKKIESVIATNPDVREYVEAAERTIREDRNRINAVEGMYGRFEQKSEQLQDNFKASLNAHQTRENDKDDRIAVLEKKLKKKTFGNKLLKVGLVVGTIGGVLLGASQ